MIEDLNDKLKKKRIKEISPVKKIKTQKMLETLVKNNGSVKKSAQELGITPGWLGYNLNSPNSDLRTQFQKVLRKSGLTDKILCKKINDGVHAEKPYGRDGDLYPDWDARHKFITLALKINNVIDNDTPISSPILINIDMPPMIDMDNDPVEIINVHA